MKQIFDANQFTPTKWSTAVDKAKFANHLIRFIEADYPEKMFLQWFYNRLSQTFGHIAHYDRWGFWEEFFKYNKDKRRFMDITLTHQPMGLPEFTFCDVERAVQKYLREKIAEFLA